MKLIADAGGTKIEWATITPDGSVSTFETPGVSPIAQGVDEMRSIFPQDLAPTEIYYYGAGCVSPDVCSKVTAALPHAEKVEVHTDLLGAARALYGDAPGLVGILGTGSNTGLYDGVGFAANMPPMGYIVGDEGSGTYLGKALLRAIYRGDEKMRREFEAWLGMGYQEIIKRVYSEPRANAFLASLVPFLAEHRDDFPWEIYDSFIEFKLSMVKFYDRGELRLVGGIAYAFAEELHLVFKDSFIQLDKIEKRPMPGLIQYHLTHES